MDESRVASAADEGMGDLLALLVEEIDRLPPCYREPLILCELDGLSRQDAGASSACPRGPFRAGSPAAVLGSASG